MPGSSIAREAGPGAETSMLRRSAGVDLAHALASPRPLFFGRPKASVRRLSQRGSRRTEAFGRLGERPWSTLRSRAGPASHAIGDFEDRSGEYGPLSLDG